jgi:dienelactone hydrolase
VRETQNLVDKTKNTATVSTTLPPWLMRHREGIIKPLLDSYITAVRAIPGTQKIGAVGFCWGGRYAVLATHDGPASVDAAYACHPSLVAVPADFEPVARPLSLAVGDSDSLLDNDSVGKIQDVLAKKTTLEHELRIYEGQVHGFALRSDWSDERDRKAMDESEKQGIEWFKKFLA